MIAKEHHKSHSKIGGLIREAVFGFNDGLVSTIALIAGLRGAVVSHSIILLASIAEMAAGAFSMGLGTYLGNKSENEVYKSELEREKYEIEHMPEIEKEEIREIYRNRGFEGDLLKQVTDKITSDKKVWLKVMMHEELGFTEEAIIKSPAKHGLTMGVSFIIGAVFPLAPYFFAEGDEAFFTAIVVSSLALLSVGALKTYFTKRPPLRSSLETLLVGLLASGGAYVIGVFIGG